MLEMFELDEEFALIWQRMNDGADIVRGSLAASACAGLGRSAVVIVPVGHAPDWTGQGCPRCGRVSRHAKAIVLDPADRSDHPAFTPVES